MTRKDYRRDVAKAALLALIRERAPDAWPTPTRFLAQQAAEMADELTERVFAFEDRRPGEIPSSTKDRDHGPTQERTPE